MTTDGQPEAWKCNVCGYVYNPGIGDPEGGVDPGTPWDEVPDTWLCPVCGVPKSMFSPA